MALPSYIFFPMLPDIPLNYLAIVAGVFLLVALLQRLPYVGGLVRVLVSLGLLALLAIVLSERVPLDPYLARIASRFHLDRQQVVGDEVRIKMAPNGHFFANVTVNGVKRRMLIDTGATVTALSTETARAAGLEPDPQLIPIILQTANGSVQARSATVDELRLGDITARDLKVVVSPAFEGMDVIGMNLLSKLKSWRVEGDTLVLIPHHPKRIEP